MVQRYVDELPATETSIRLTTHTQEKRADVVAKCILSEPRHGEFWQAVAKDPKNARRSIEDVLKMVVAQLE